MISLMVTVEEGFCGHTQNSLRRRRVGLSGASLRNPAAKRRRCEVRLLGVPATVAVVLIPQLRIHGNFGSDVETYICRSCYIWVE